MEVGTVLIFANLLVCECKHLIDIVQSFRVDVSGSVSESISTEHSRLTVLSLQVIQAAQSCPVWAVVAS
jgi:hypothetical protein